MLWRPCSDSFPRAQSTSFLISYLRSFQGMLEVSNYRSQCLRPCRTDGKRHMLVGTFLKIVRSLENINLDSRELSGGRDPGHFEKWPSHANPRVNCNKYYVMTVTVMSGIEENIEQCFGFLLALLFLLANTKREVHAQLYLVHLSFWFTY